MPCCLKTNLPPVNQKSFAHLHVHTEYSMLDGAARLNQLISEVKKQEMPAIAITDHGNLYGAYDFYKTAKEFEDAHTQAELMDLSNPQKHRFGK